MTKIMIKRAVHDWRRSMQHTVAQEQARIAPCSVVHSSVGAAALLLAAYVSDALSAQTGHTHKCINILANIYSQHIRYSCATVLDAISHYYGARWNSTLRNFVLPGPIITKLGATDYVSDHYWYANFSWIWLGGEFPTNRWNWIKK